jgi:aquaporin Z
LARGKSLALSRKAIAELVGTFALVFAGTGAIVVDELSGGRVTHVGVSLTFGLVVMAMVFTFGEISGAHLNPAVSLGLSTNRQMSWKHVPTYVGAQVVGAVLASLVLQAIFPSSPTLGLTVPAGNPAQSFVLETVLTFFLMLVVLAVPAGTEKASTAPFAVGGIVALDALFGGPISGASMNPARSLGPALVLGSFGHLWLYLVAPCAGSLAAVALWRMISSARDVPRR